MLASLATLSCIDAASAQPDLDLRIERPADPVGPRRDDADADDTAEEPGETELEESEADTTPLDPEDLAIRAVVPEPPAARTSIGPPPEAPTGRVPGTGAPNLYAQFTAGASLAGALGGRLLPRLALGVTVRATAYAFDVHGHAHGLEVLNVDSMYAFGPMVDWYPRNGHAHLRLRLGAAAIGLDETRLIEMVEVRTHPTRLGPSLDLGVGMQWRPIGTFGRFRLGLVVEGGASTVTSGGNRIGVFDVGLATTVTWF